MNAPNRKVKTRIDYLFRVIEGTRGGSFCMRGKCIHFDLGCWFYPCGGCRYRY